MLIVRPELPSPNFSVYHVKNHMPSIARIDRTSLICDRTPSNQPL
ncbi:hypothetical protein CKA32_003287 [Geitlerinema sp. FC II]|nr:hypothetical protein CKA32_003287 [Geitlerinema sp. FC II]